MINKSNRNWLLSLTLVSGLFSATASAQNLPNEPGLPAAPTLPSECSARRDSSAWTAGKSAGESRLNSVWRSTAVGQDLDNLSDVLPNVLDSVQQYLTALTGNQPPTLNIKCRAQGYTEGFVFGLNKLFKQCVLDGADWGQFAADVYCRLSIELGGLSAESLFVRAPAGLCANRFEFTCEEVYRNVATDGAHVIHEVVQSYLEEDGFTVETYPGCGIYTDNEWLEAFESSLHNECSAAIEE
jgi:hypothetical protein